MMHRALIQMTVASALLAALPAAGAEAFSMETATLGATGQNTGGFSISSQQFLGAKLEVVRTARISELGGHLRGTISGSLFAAVVPLSRRTDLPGDFSLANAVFATSFSPPSSSAEVTLAADFVLQPGRYALIFGSGLFGATGSGTMPCNDTDIGSPEYFFSDQVTPSYTDGGLNDCRFFIRGSTDELRFETAALGPIGETTGGASVTSSQFLGAKLELARAARINELGGHLRRTISGSLFAAVVPLDPGSDLPSDFTLSNAVFATSFDPASPSAEVTLPVDFVLQPGRYALVFGSGLFGATGSGAMPCNDTDIGSPEYFFSDQTDPSYTDGGLNGCRFFVYDATLVFADGFEAGDVSAWSSSGP